MAPGWLSGGVSQVPVEHGTGPALACSLLEFIMGLCCSQTALSPRPTYQGRRRKNINYPAKQAVTKGSISWLPGFVFARSGAEDAFGDSEQGGMRAFSVP